MTKYGFNQPINSSKKRLTNQLWKLLPLKEEDGNWEKQLDSVIVEIAGLHEIFKNSLDFLTLLSKLEGIRKIDKFEVYRRTIFESITLFNEIYHE